MMRSSLDVELVASSLIPIAENYIVCNMTKTSMASKAERAERLDYVAGNLLSRAALLVRLLVKQVRNTEISRTEGEVLIILSEGPRRITELAELEGVAQPTMTLLIKRLEENGWVQREGLAQDGRVVMITITKAGNTAVEAFRAQFLAAMRTDLEELSDQQLAALSDATETLGSFVDVLRQRVGE
jgi:DNA-binding MarR family transcriptional regulator